MLKRPLNSNEEEYEIRYSTNEIEQKFYEYFLEYIKSINFDIAEHQIIVNPFKFKVEIRIRMNKLHMCFSNEFGLGMLMQCYCDRDGSFVDICERVIKPVKDYATSLCYKD